MTDFSDGSGKKGAYHKLDFPLTKGLRAINGCSPGGQGLINGADKGVSCD
jgi:hypothetical protein